MKQLEKLYLPETKIDVIAKGGYIEGSVNTKVIYKINDIIDNQNEIIKLLQQIKEQQ